MPPSCHTSSHSLQAYPRRQSRSIASKAESLLSTPLRRLPKTAQAWRVSQHQYDTRRHDSTSPRLTRRDSAHSRAAIGFLTLLALFALSRLSGTNVPIFLTPFDYLRPTRPPSKISCDPYMSFGSLQIDHVDPDGTRWVPFEGNRCKPPHFFKRLRHNDQSTDMDWVRNRTILLFGDQIERHHVEEFCNLMGYEAEIVRQSHTLAPRTTAARATSRPDRLEKRPAPDSSLPRICHIPDYGLTLASVFHYGLDQEDFFGKVETIGGPSMLEHRLVDVVKPFILNLARAHGQMGPDLVEFSSGLFDLERFALLDLDVGKDPEAALEPERLAWYRFRVGQALAALGKTFPDAKAQVWRSQHFPIDQVAEYRWFRDESRSPARSGPAHFAVNRIHQLDDAVRSLMLPAADGFTPPHAAVRYNPWGSLMLGHAAHQPDRLHGEPGAPGTTLWADIILFELHRAVTRGGSFMQAVRAV